MKTPIFYHLLKHESEEFCVKIVGKCFDFYVELPCVCFDLLEAMQASRERIKIRHILLQKRLFSLQFLYENSYIQKLRKKSCFTKKRGHLLHPLGQHKKAKAAL